MDNIDLTLPPELDSALNDFYTAPQPDPAFAARLELNLRRRHQDLTLPPTDPRPGAALLQTLRAKPALMVLTALLALMLLSGAAYALGRLTGYIPGFGFADDTGALLTLDGPAETAQAGVSLRVIQATGDSQRFSITIAQQGQPSNSGPYAQSSAALFTPDGTALEFRESLGSSYEDGGPGLLTTFEFAPLPPGINELRLRYKIVEYPAEGQENSLWQADLSLRLRPLRAGEIIPSNTQDAWQPLASASQGGLRLALENVAAASDKTILQVALRFDQPHLFLVGDWNVHLTSADGTTYPLTLVLRDSNNQVKTYETVPFTGRESLTLSLTAFPDQQALTLFKDLSDNAPSFTFDPGLKPSPGQTWALNETLQVGEHTLHVLQAALSAPNTLTFTLQSDSDLVGLLLYSEAASGANNNPFPAPRNNLQATLTFTSLPEHPFTIHLVRVYYTVQGEWRLTWQAPAAPTDIQIGGSATPPATPDIYIPPTPAFSDPLWLQLIQLTASFDADFQHGPGWIHTLTATETSPRPGQTFPPPYITSEEWLEVDEQGYVIRTVHTDRDAAGRVIQQAISVGDRYVNFTLGESGYLGGKRYRFSSSFLLQDFNAALENNTEISITETPCGQSQTCYLITAFDTHGIPAQNPDENQIFGGQLQQTWVDKASGQTLKVSAMQRLQDGSQQTGYTQTWLTLEKLPIAPQDILDLLEKTRLP